MSLCAKKEILWMVYFEEHEELGIFFSDKEIMPDKNEVVI